MDRRAIKDKRVIAVVSLIILVTGYFVFIHSTRKIAAVERPPEDTGILEETIKSLIKSNEDLQQLVKKQVSKEKRVISYSLYGNVTKMTMGALTNAHLAKLYMPGWIPRFYVDKKSVDPKIIATLKEYGAEVVFPDIDFKEKNQGRFIRFSVMDDETVDRWAIRDVDSRLSARESGAVEEWIASGRPFHVMRDNPNHSVQMPGGMWGGTRKGLKGKTYKELLAQWFTYDKEDFNARTSDQRFLDLQIWPLVYGENHLGHDAFYCNAGWWSANPFPVQRHNFEHVGGVYDEFGIPETLSKEVVPMQCRGRPEWTYG